MKTKMRLLLRQKGATTSVSTKGLCVTGWGNPPSPQHASVMMRTVIYRGRDGGGGVQRVEPGGKGCAIIRSLRGGMRSVAEALSLRIQAEPPNRGRTDREHLYDTHTGKRVLECDLRLSVIWPVIVQIKMKDRRKVLMRRGLVIIYATKAAG